MNLRNHATCLLAIAPLGAALVPDGERPRRESIDRPADVLPDAIVRQLDPDLRNRILGGGDVPIYLLVNPDLGDRGDARALRSLVHPPGSVPFQSPGTLDLLLDPTWDDRPVLYTLLKDVSGQFLRQFFGDDVQKGDSLEKLIAKGALLSNRIILITVDATCQGVEGPAEGYSVELWFRIYRVDYDEAKYPYPVRAMELLFSDHAIGTAFPREDGGQIGDDELRSTFRAAIVDAIRDQIALSLWGSARMTGHGWLGEQRADLVGQPLSQEPHQLGDNGPSEGRSE